ncbi:MAG: hypothetical protein LBS46_09180 [Dysgonamonadaceae bacterium]|jgi:hypothetical protein|nr:hypothetical protein [Dysgonamonadaceae bacterium]
MKTKKKNYLIAFIAMLLLVHTSSWGQTYDGERTATTQGNIDVENWITPVGGITKYLFKIPVERADPQLVKTGVGTWSSPGRAFPVGYPTGYNNAQWAPSLLPGIYFIDGGAKGYVLYDIQSNTPPTLGQRRTNKQQSQVRICPALVGLSPQKNLLV